MVAGSHQGVLPDAKDVDESLPVGCHKADTARGICAAPESDSTSTLQVPTLSEVKKFLSSDDKYLDVKAEVVWQNYVEQVAEVKAQQASSTSPMHDVEKPGNISPMKAPTLAEVKGFLCKEYTDLEAEEIRQSYVEQVAEIKAQQGIISPMKAPTLAEVKGFL